MIEYRIHGRGGQGSVAAAYLLASAAFEAGHTCQAFPAFGAERRGAPVTAFVRIDNQPIHLRSQVRAPDFLIVQDDTLLMDRGITGGLKPGGSMIVNTKRTDEEVSETFGCRAKCIPATELALEHIGKPIPNTALLAALLALTGDLPVEALAAAVRGRFKGTTLSRNLELIEHSAGLMPQGSWREVQDA
ncbi:2-oxoacid:acceptor oxidoreductase family protein [Tropicimonas sp. IMCC34043]|uniref:2-oxoacid:acceptor oxidoreductase family protein n=1 Tax=Tropicimonas sp. IMCC34043 TaxID=2248760 RepID=UPI000E231B4C|nr:2-oxoacid:acceptor oxidoreductase family protein [Tropicimonas sp. IMCC34043]